MHLCNADNTGRRWKRHSVFRRLPQLLVSCSDVPHWKSSIYLIFSALARIWDSHLPTLDFDVCRRGNMVFFFADPTQTHPKNICDLVIMNQRSINHLASRQVQNVVWSVLRNRSIFNASLSKKNWHNPLVKGGVTKSKKPWCRMITGGSHISISWS